MPPEASLPTVSLQDLEFSTKELQVSRVVRTYRKFGCAVIRGLFQSHVEEIHRDIEAAASQAISLLPRAEKVVEGWRTPDGTLFLPAPEGFQRDKQIMVLALHYRNSGAFFRSALDPGVLALAGAILGPDVELFGPGQCLYKEPAGGHPKKLHQDAAYFEHRFEGPLGVLTYVVPTDLKNGTLHIVPGSHKLGVLEHKDTFSHLGLDEEEWTWDRALPVPGQPGDAILFHVNLIHGSQPNISDKPRPVLIYRYRRADDYVTVSATTAENREGAEKLREQASKEKQAGFMVQGFRTLLEQD